MSDLIIKNGRVWTDGDLCEKNIAILDGKVQGLLTEHDNIDSGVETIDAAGKLIFPGGVDMHAHVQDGAETFHDGTAAALKGGITTVLDMPPFKTVTNALQTKKRADWGEREAVSDFGLIGGIIIDQNDLQRLEETIDCGVHLFKIFMLSNPSTELIWNSVQFAARTGMRLVVHMEEPALLREVDWDDPFGFPKANPPESENVAVAQLLEMARAAGAPVHVCHVSSGRSAELIDAYKGWGVDVTAETTPHYLVMNDEEFQKQPERVIATPALRKAEDNRILWQALEDGVIDAIITDHFLGALPSASKERPLPKDAEPGIASLEVTFPLLYDRGYRQGNISLKRLVKAFASRPAQLANIDYCKGTISKGMDADMIIFDPNASWKVGDLGRNSRISTLPYEGWELEGKLEKTLVRGATAWDGKSITTAPGFGRYIAAKKT